MSEQEDTKPIDVSDLLGLDDDEVEAARKRLPDAASVRAGLVAVLIFVGAFLGKPELSHNHWVDALISAYVVVAPLGLAWWIRRHTKDSSPGRHRAS